MDARQITVSLRRDPREIAERHSQANPLTLRCELARGEAVTQELNLYAELHASRTPQSSPLASAGPVAMSAASEGPWDLDFSAAQMNQTVLPGEDREFWLVVYATGANDLLLTLGTIRLTLAYDNISQVTPAPPEPALILAFRTIAVAGQSPIVADSSADTLTIAAGNGIVLTTDPTTDTLTITAAGGVGSGDVTGPNGATDNALARFDGTTGKIIQSSTATLSDAGALAVTDATVSGTLTAPHIHGNLAGAVYSHIRNESGGPLTKGTPVYVTGYSVGQTRSLVAAANAASSATMPAIGILDEDLANNASGHCVISGNITDLNTAAYTVNAPLYVAIGGGLTATAPSVRAQPIAIVERVNANNGSIIVTPAATVGSLANQSAANVAITGGSITGITDLAVADGGTGASTASVALSNLGGYPASNPAGYTSNAGTVTNVTGTAPIAVTNGTTTPAITVATFGSSNSGVVPASGGGTTNFLRADGSWAAPPGGTGGAPTDADYLVRTANGSLSAERVVGDSTTVTANWATAGQVSFERAALTGDVTASANSNTTTIANDAVTYAKIQNVTASRLLGRASGTSGDIEEITLGTNLSFSGTTLNAAGGSGASVTVSDTPPGTPAAGDLWWNSADGNLYLWYQDGTSEQWVSAAYIPTGGGAGGGTGTVTSVSVVSANGITGSVANASTTPAITLTLDAITPTSVNGVAISGSSTPTLAVTGTTSVSGANTGDQTITLSGAVTGNGTGAIITALSDNAVTESKIASNAVTANKISAGAVTYSKIQNVIGNAVLANNSGSSGPVQEVTLAASQLLGRGATGNIAPIDLGSGLSMIGTTLSATGSSATVDVKYFTSSADWTNPSPSVRKLVFVRLVGGGGGGGGGRCDVAGTSRFGGGGGSAGGCVEAYLWSNEMPSVLGITVGAGGTAGSGSTTQGTSGTNGGNGGATSFVIDSVTFRAPGGNGGGGGSATAGAAGAQVNNALGGPWTGAFNSVAGGSSIVTAIANAGTTPSLPSAPTAAGGGGGISSVNQAYAGGNSAAIATAINGSVANIVGGAESQVGNGGNGTSGNTIRAVGRGGSGGGAGAGGTGGNGGNGGFGGGAGAGGGAGLTGSGNGGTGGAGYAIIITYH